MAARQAASNDKASDDLDDLKGDIDKLREDLLTLTQHMKSLGGNALSEAQQKGAEKVDLLRTELERTAKQVRSHGEASLADFEKTIRDKPLLSLAAAFGVGMLISRLLDRS